MRGADLLVRRGEIMGLVGESGCGKSMTAMACLGLVPPPGRVSGHVSVDGFEVVGRPDRELLPVARWARGHDLPEPRQGR